MSFRDDQIVGSIHLWYQRAQPDYALLYGSLYIAYTTWMKQVAAVKQDNDARGYLRKRSIIWKEYLPKHSLMAMQGMARQIQSHLADFATVTDTSGFQYVNISKVTLKDDQDWGGLIDYWYAVRCDLFHGNYLSDQLLEGKTIELAYKSLNIFMTEVVIRMENYFSDREFQQMKLLLEVVQARKMNSDRYPRGSDEYQVAQKSYQEATVIYRKLYQKYLDGYEPWTIDGESNEPSYKRSLRTEGKPV